MIKNYFKTAFRTLHKNKSYSAINITGLAVSLAAAVLLLLWVWDELGYDRMHSKGDRTYVMTATLDPNGQDVWYSTPSAIAGFGKNEIPAIQSTVRVNDGGTSLIEYQGKRFQESVRFTDPDFFQVFDFPFLAGNRELPFANLHSVVISESVAKKYFGDADPMGKIVQIDKTKSFQVSGVFQDMPHNSSLQYNVLFPFELLGEEGNRDLNGDWANFNYETYLLLKPGSDPQQVSEQLTGIHLDHNKEYADILKDFSYGLFPLLDLHLKGDSQRYQQVQIFIVVALVILLIACINYVNLVTARSSRRSKEVSVRKIVGANRTHLFWQFISESFVVFIISMMFAIALVYLAMPMYRELSAKDFVFSLLDHKVWVLFGASLLVVLMVAGVYPALMLSTFKPALALKGILPGLGKNNGFRRVLVVVQFTCSVILIVSTIVIGKQLAFIRQVDLGYDKENTMMFKRQNFGNLETIKAELKKQPGILGVTASSAPLDNAQSFTTAIDWEGKPASMNKYTINQLSVERDFIEVMGMELVAGNGFTRTGADSTSFILNETAAKQMGFEDPIGKSLTHQGRAGTIVGVVKDFHFQNMKNAIGPLILFTTWGTDNIYVRTTAREAKQAVAAVDKLWKQYNADYEFNYTFMDEAFDRQYREDIRTGLLFNIFAGIAIFLSCLGLFGLVTYTAETKIKEIGIRKTLGASVSNIIVLISQDFLKLVGISFIVAFPLAWWMMNSWLENYAYRTTIEWWIFAFAGFGAFAIATLTVCGKSLRAAKENPIKSIGTE